MKNLLSKLLDAASDFFAKRKGLLPVLAIFLVLLNFIVRLMPNGWLAQTDIFLHAGVIIGLFGIMLAWAL